MEPTRRSPRSLRSQPPWPIRAFLMLLIAAGLSVTASALAASDTPVAATRGADGYLTERGDAGRRPRASLEDFDPRAVPGGDAKASPAAPGQRAVSCCGFRIHDAYTELFDDFDRDGYYTYLRVTFDVDTDYPEAEVYADLWLREPGGRYVLVYETETFAIRGSSATDDYEVEVELVAGFPPDLYDVLIEVYDAWDRRFVADFDALDSPALGLLPLEDISFDGDPPPPVVRADGAGGSGSFSLAGLAALAALVLLGRWRHISGRRGGHGRWR